MIVLPADRARILPVNPPDLKDLHASSPSITGIFKSRITILGGSPRPLNASTAYLPSSTI